MTDILLILILIVGIICTALAAIIFLSLRKNNDKESQSLVMQQLNHMNQVLDQKLSESSRTIQTQFSQSASIIAKVTEKLTRLDETNKQVVNFADQLKSLQDVLKNPKQRGVLGEYYLEAVLKNVLPPGTYQTQYAFKDGTKVDAVVFADKRIIPIDSKFSLENYNRILETNNPDEKKRYEGALVNDLKTRIDETSKYIKPEEKTMDFAFMFIPSEAVFYDLLINKVGAMAGETDNLIYYAAKKKVVVVSPTSFLAYLQTVLQGLRNQKISEEAQEIIKEVERLGKHLFVYSEYMKKVGDHLGVTVSSYNKAGRELGKIDKDVVKLTGGDSRIKIKDVEPPALEE